jgi:chromosome segregation ATPase
LPVTETQHPLGLWDFRCTLKFMEPEVRERFEQIEAILKAVAERQAAAEARMDRADARMDRAEARMDRAEVRMDRAEARVERLEARFEKRIHGLAKLAQIGMKELFTMRRLQRETDEKLNALIDAQQRTDASLRALMDSLRRGGNGHGGRAR